MFHEYNYFLLLYVGAVDYKNFAITTLADNHEDVTSIPIDDQEVSNNLVNDPPESDNLPIDQVCESINIYIS